MSEPYDFEYPYAPPASCNRCGALVVNREIHGAWHDRAQIRCSAVNLKTGRRCTLDNSHDGEHLVSDGRWFS